MKRPKLQPDLSPAKFREAVKAHAAALDRWIELSVDAFPSDPASRAERLARVNDKETGFRFFVETYLPHYVKGDASLFHEAVFERFPEIIHGQDGNQKKGAKDTFVAPRGSSKSTHLSLGGALYVIALGLENYILEICDVYSQAALLIEAIKSELTANPRLAHGPWGAPPAILEKANRCLSTKPSSPEPMTQTPSRSMLTSGFTSGSRTRRSGWWVLMHRKSAGQNARTACDRGIGSASVSLGKKSS